MGTGPAPRRTHEQGERTRRRILDASRSLMAERGYAATSISAISAAADVRPASIYWAFGSKEGLFAAVLDDASAEWFAARTLPGPLATLDDFWAWFATLRDGFVDGPEFLRLLLVLSLERRDGDPEVIAAARRVREVAGQFVAAALEPLLDPVLDEDQPGRRREVSAEIGALAVLLLDGLFIESQIAPDADVDHLFATITHALAATLQARLTGGPP